MYKAGAHCSLGRPNTGRQHVMLKFYLLLKLKISSTAILPPSLPATAPPPPPLPKMNSHWSTQKSHAP